MSVVYKVSGNKHMWEVISESDEYYFLRCTTMPYYTMYAPKSECKKVKQWTKN